MKREISFRGFDGGDWIYGSAVLYDETQDAWYLIEKDDPADEWMMVGRVGQYTGLKDKNDAKIFEGDIIKNTTVFGEYVGEIVFHEGAFQLKTNRFGINYELLKETFEYSDMGASSTLSNSYEVFGTVHDEELNSL